MQATEITVHEGRSCQTGSRTESAPSRASSAQLHNPILKIIRDHNEKYAFATTRIGVVVLSVLGAVFVPWGHVSAVLVVFALLTACSFRVIRPPIDMCAEEFVPDEVLGILAASSALDDDTRDALRSAADAAGGLSARVLHLQAMQWEHARRERERREAPGYRALMGHHQPPQSEDLS